MYRAGIRDDFHRPAVIISGISTPEAARSARYGRCGPSPGPHLGGRMDRRLSWLTPRPNTGALASRTAAPANDTNAGRIFHLSAFDASSWGAESLWNTAVGVRSPRPGGCAVS